MNDRKKRLVDEIAFYRDLIASRHATVDTIQTDVQRLEILLAKAEVAFEDEDDSVIETLSDEIVRVTVNRIALLLTDAQKTFVRGQPNLRFKTSVDVVKEIHSTIKDFNMNETTKEWFQKNCELLEGLAKIAESAGKGLPGNIRKKQTAA